MNKCLSSIRGGSTVLSRILDAHPRHCRRMPHILGALGCTRSVWDKYYRTRFFFNGLDRVAPDQSLLSWFNCITLFSVDHDSWTWLYNNEFLWCIPCIRIRRALCHHRTMPILPCLQNRDGHTCLHTHPYVQRRLSERRLQQCLRLSRKIYISECFLIVIKLLVTTINSILLYLLLLQV